MPKTEATQYNAFYIKRDRLFPMFRLAQVFLEDRAVLAYEKFSRKVKEKPHAGACR
jgi:hypothetical protein